MKYIVLLLTVSFSLSTLASEITCKFNSEDLYQHLTAVNYPVTTSSSVNEVDKYSISIKGDSCDEAMLGMLRCISKTTATGFLIAPDQNGRNGMALNMKTKKEIEGQMTCVEI